MMIKSFKAKPIIMEDRPVDKGFLKYIEHTKKC